MGEEFEKAKSYLQVADDKGVTLYDHVAALILRLLKDKPDHNTGRAQHAHTGEGKDDTEQAALTAVMILCVSVCGCCFSIV